MKKIYVLALALLFVGAAIGQNSMIYPTGKAFKQNQTSKIELGQKKITSKSNERWYNYGDAMDLIVNGISELYIGQLFPDSNITQVYSDQSTGTIWIHKLADVFDPAVINFNDETFFPGEMALMKNSTYTLDSITILCKYKRGNYTPNAVDTLIFDVAVIDRPHAAVGCAWFSSTSQVSINLLTDSTKFVDVAYKHTTNSFDINPHTTYKIPLTDSIANDTIAFGRTYISCVPNLTIDANKIVVVSVSFKPNYTWIAFDTIDHYNSFQFFSYNEGPNAFPIYTKNDWNVSYILPTDVRYNAAGGWNGSYIPSFAYMGSTTGVNTWDAYIHHLLYYKCTGVSDYSTTSIQENNADDNMLGNAYPNPANGNSELIIPVNTNDAKASLIISNVVGQQIMKINTIQNGQVVLNTSELNAGLYFYTLYSGKNTTTKRFTVIK